jgi:hypothetical protein
MSKTPRHPSPARVRPTVTDWDGSLGAVRDALSALHVDTAVRKDPAVLNTAFAQQAWVDAAFRRLNARVLKATKGRHISAAPNRTDPTGRAAPRRRDTATWLANGVPDMVVVDNGPDLQSHGVAELEPCPRRKAKGARAHGRSGAVTLCPRRRA